MQTSFFTQSQASQGTTGVASALGGNSTTDLFTTLLIAQIKNQNPLEPTDPSAFVAQLTQLSQMEALQAMNRQSSTNSAMLESLQALGLGAQVGSELMVQTDQINLDGKAVHGAFTLQNASPQTTLVLSDAQGQQYSIELGSQAPGAVNFAIDPATLGLPAGPYTLAVHTSTKEAPSVEVAGTLQSVRLSPTGGVLLNVSHLGEVAPSSVTRFNGRTAS
ncbi:MAG TPA: flagellar hook capping FlgD N-terminal domain-containing protein [Aquabacterium sp.]|nr:flagellar hook capping FlgD N-terminal domain-containing protein [Aquabacterium sp.]